MQLPYACVCCRRWKWTAVGLCDHCRPRLFDLVDTWERPGPPASRGLFTWREDDPPVYSWVVRGLKGVEDPERWRVLASWMLEALGPPPTDAVLVPIPARGPNHALGLARALGELSGHEVRDELRMKSRSSQKRLGRGERRAIELECKGGNIDCNTFTAVWIVDDVITTGATAGAAYRALGRPEICEVWTVLDRRPCGESGRLL